MIEHCPGKRRRCAFYPSFPPVLTRHFASSAQALGPADHFCQLVSGSDGLNRFSTIKDFFARRPLI